MGAKSVAAILGKMDPVRELPYRLVAIINRRIRSRTDGCIRPCPCPPEKSLAPKGASTDGKQTYGGFAAIAATSTCRCYGLPQWQTIR